MALRISRGDVAGTSPASITNSKFIASFNWEASDRNKFLSPGFPPLLKENEQIVQLQKDSPNDFVDETFVRNEKYPNEVVFRAIEVCDPGFSWDDICIVTGRSPLRRLVEFLNGNPEAFVFYIDKVGSRCVFTRSPRPKAMYPGYGHYFEKVNTRMDRTVGNPKHFNCILQYQLGEVKLVVKSEVDAVQSKAVPYSARNLADGEEGATLKWISQEGSSLQHAKAGSLISKQDHRLYELKTVNQLVKMTDRWESIYY